MINQFEVFCILLGNNQSVHSIEKALGKLHDSKTQDALEPALELAQSVLSLFIEEPQALIEDIVSDGLLQLPNAERQDSWFVGHPWMEGAKSAFEIFDGAVIPIQAKFFWLKKRTSAQMAGAVHFTANWEDFEYTRQSDEFKVGIDFFLSPDAKCFYIVLSSSGKLRVMELTEKLNRTQAEIFESWTELAHVRVQSQIHAALWQSFQLQSVNALFYSGVSDAFLELVDSLVKSGKGEQDSKLFTSRLLGRLIFTWFLRKMNLISDAVVYFNPVDFESDSAYYKNSLETLFFRILNEPISARMPLGGVVDLETPYLNGGLFAPHENDWAKEEALTIPNGYFYRLFEHFQRFNFTVDESTPEFEQVAIDPEMLGRVFESLLATQVDDTGKQARKAKGTFYTPREIVSHMCKESVRSSFKSKAGNDLVLHKAIDNLLDVSDRDWSANGTNSIKWAIPLDRRTDFLAILDSLSAFDPACGSGAFPMGLVNLLMRIHERIDPSLDKHETKLKIVQNNIFGSDIEPMAVEISRLRAWLSIIVEREKGKAIEPLPNLDFNFVCANSLVPLADVTVDLFNDPEFNIKLDEVRRKYFSATSPEKKAKLRQDYYKISKSDLGIMEDRRTTQLRTFDPFVNTHPAEFFESTHMFGKHSFDIVIGNPPYGAKLSAAHKALFKSVYVVARTENGVKGSTDTYAAFMEMGLKLLARGGNLHYILPISVMTSDAMSQAHKLFESQCEILKFAAFSVRPRPIFENATVNVAILQAIKTESPNNKILTTKLYRKNETISVSDIVSNLKYQDVSKLKMRGRYPKISDDIEVGILDKLQKIPTKLGDLISESGLPIFYRAAGGRYFKIITNYTTNSSAERRILIAGEYVGLVGALLSTSLFFWYYQLFSDNLNLKTYEIESFPIPVESVNPRIIQTAEELYEEYLIDIEKNSNVRKTEKYAHISEFREYKLGRSIELIDKLDDALGGLFGLTSEEIDYIKGYERSFRLEDDDSDELETSDD